MMQSNQPYQRVSKSDSIWDGAAWGVGAYATSTGVSEMIMRKTNPDLAPIKGSVARFGKGKASLLFGAGAALWGGIGAGIDALNK